MVKEKVLPHGISKDFYAPKEDDSMAFSGRMMRCVSARDSE